MLFLVFPDPEWRLYLVLQTVVPSEMFKTVTCRTFRGPNGGLIEPLEFWIEPCFLRAGATPIL